MQMIKGTQVKLYGQTVTGIDDFGAEEYTETEIIIDNVLIGEPSTDDVLSEVNLTGKRVAYTLAIPKEDTNDWVNKTVAFYGLKWRTIGIPTQYIEGNMPDWFPWNKKVKVEAFE